MLIEIDTHRYSRVKRGDALSVLEQAKLTPDKFTAHRDGTFTAKFTKKRSDLFGSLAYEDRMENSASQHNIAIFKRPSARIDRGPYVSLRFGFVAIERLGLAGDALTQNGNGANGAHHHEGDIAILTHLKGVTRDAKQLAQYAHEVMANDTKHALVAVGELQKQITLIGDELEKLLKSRVG